MNDRHSRTQTLLSVTRKNWAQAIRGLHRVEAELTEIESDLRKIQRDIVALQSALESRPALGRVRAGRLQTDAFTREQKRVQLGYFEERERNLTNQFENAAGRVDEAKKEVIKTHKALTILSA